MNILSVTHLSKYYGDRLLLDDITFYIDKGQKVALIARNGSGKSTLLKLLQGKDIPESGEIKFHKDISTGFLEQDPEFDNKKTVYETILHTDHPMLRASLAYEQALEGIGDLQKAMENMELLHAWDYEVQVKQILSLLQIPEFNQKVGSLSGGQKKRLSLAILLLLRPDILILDEPTNHLDLDMIEWLEEYLSSSNITLLMVTHDRYFLENICDEMLELEEGKIFKHKGSYSSYLENKVIREDTMRSNIGKARNLMRKELEWIRRQPKARGTKAKSRVEAFDTIRERASQKVNQEQVEMEIKMSRIGGKILELYNVSKSFGNKVVLDNFSYKFKRGERVGIVGKNGCGKSTFLHLITGTIPFDKGKIVPGETIVFGYYTQDGMQLKADKRVIEVVKDIAEFIPAGKGHLTAAQMLERFLFDPGKQYQYVSTLSGGEKRRLYLLTILMKNPNFLILDEPTNDLDIITLQVLEDFLSEFKGCLVIVSHDRYFLDKLTDHLFIFEEAGQMTDFNGNYREYREYKRGQEQLKKQSKDILEKDRLPGMTEIVKKKLSYREIKALETLEKEISTLENEKKHLQECLVTGETNHQIITDWSVRLKQVIHLLEEKEMRWLDLSEQA